jgi:hypothetical protein
MIPLRFEYFFLPLLAALTVWWTVAGYQPLWVWPLVWLTIGAFLVFRAWQQLRRDLRFARGGKRASRDYPLEARGDVAGEFPVSGNAASLVYFTARRKGESFRLSINPPVIRMWVEDEAGKTVPEVDIGRVESEPAMVRELEHNYHGKHRRRRPGPGGELYVPNEGPWRFHLRFTVQSPRDKSERLVFQVRVWGRSIDVRLPDAPEVHATAAPV